MAAKKIFQGRTMQFYLLLLTLATVQALPGRGVWTVNYDKTHRIHAFVKSMYNGTIISVKGLCTTADVELHVSWSVRYSPCAGEYLGVEDEESRENFYIDHGELQDIEGFNYPTVEIMTGNSMFTCSPAGDFYLDDHTGDQPIIYNVNQNATKPSTGKTTLDVKTKDKAAGGEAESRTKHSTTLIPESTSIAITPKTKNRTKREDDNASDKKPPTVEKSKNGTKKMDADAIDHHDFAKVWKDGYFIFVLRISSQDDFAANVTVRMMGAHGYISAVDWPLLIFYGVMGIVYIVYGLIWLVLLACNWRDLLRVQYWIGAVIILGMLEKAVFYAEYQNIAKYGESVRGAVIIAELVSCVKRMLARMLVIIVSLGFGIVKPRLGPTLHKVLGVGALYFIFASIEGCMRAVRPKGDQSKDLLLADVPLAITDASICWWIFTSLVQTTRTLRLKRNIVKLSLYRHFTNTLIFAVLASIVYMIWSIVQHKMKVCLTDWKELWVDEAYWHFLFSIILLIIMILWRPTANNQRYAFTPLLDSAEDELEEEALMNDAFEGMSMRSKQGNDSPRQKDRNTVEDDLKWVEEHIPQSITDKALPSLLDSDEEIMTAKYEMSKMQ